MEIAEELSSNDSKTDDAAPQSSSGSVKVSSSGLVAADGATALPAAATTTPTVAAAAAAAAAIPLPAIGQCIRFRHDVGAFLASLFTGTVIGMHGNVATVLDMAVAEEI